MLTFIYDFFHLIIDSFVGFEDVLFMYVVDGKYYLVPESIAYILSVIVVIWFFRLLWQWWV